MRRLGLPFIAAGMVAATQPAAAEQQSIELTTPIGSQTIVRKLKGADELLVRGFVIGGSALRHEVVFTSSRPRLAASLSWRVGESGADFRLVGVNLDLLEDDGTVVASDAFDGLLGGVAVSTLSFADLRPAKTYKLVITGTITSRGVYTLIGDFDG